MILKSQKLYVGEFDLSGNLQGLAYEAAAEIQDDTVSGDVARSGVAGLVDFALEHEGVWEAGAGKPDPVFYGNIGLNDVLASAVPEGGDEGNVCHFARTTQGVYTPAKGSVGDLLRFSVSLRASGGIGAVRGTLMHNNTRTATGSSAAKRQLGAVSATQKLYAGLHVLAASGTTPTLDVTIRSDADSSAGGETVRGTFAQKTAVGSEWLTPVAGAITDQWWDIRWVIGGTSPSFQFVVVVGIQ